MKLYLVLVVATYLVLGGFKWQSYGARVSFDGLLPIASSVVSETLAKVGL